MKLWYETWKVIYTKSLKKLNKKVDEVGYVLLQITAFIDLKIPFSCIYYTQFATVGLWKIIIQILEWYFMGKSYIVLTIIILFK